MVRVDSMFVVELVDAQTKTPFKEHTSQDGTTYIEAEPDAEYFIRIEVDAEEKILAKAIVDGGSLGYRKHCWKVPRTADNILGIRKKNDGKTALKFSRVRRNLSGGIGSWKGTVKVDFFKAIPNGPWEDFTASWDSTDDNISGEKAVKTIEGSIVFKRDYELINKDDLQYRRGDIIKTVELHCCSAVGLINAGIIPRPPMWDLHRMSNPRSRSRTVKETPRIVTPKKIKLTSQAEDGTILESRELDFYDLTVVSDSGEDDT